MADIQIEKTVKPNLTPEILVPRLGDYLVEKGLLNEAALAEALRHQSANRSLGKNQLLGEVLVELGFIDRPSLDAAVTEQIMQLRAALVETNAQLERRVQERTRELQEALEKLSELSQLKSNFIANISHELRTPLTHIKGYVELLLSGAMGDLQEPQENALGVVKRSTDRLEQQIEDLIHFSLAARGEFTLHFAPFRISTLAQILMSRAASKAIDKGVRLVIQLPEHLPSVRGDSEKISWALLQLVDNAVKFTPQGGSVTVSACQVDGFVEVNVVDTGIGIPADRFEEIFQPFHQLDGSATRRYGGTGLGLALVRQILDAHGARVHLESELGKGSRFYFAVPIADMTAAES